MKSVSAGVRVALLFLLLAVGAYIVWKNLGQNPAGKDTQVLFARFRDASGLPKGSKVVVAGLPQGEVTELAVEPLQSVDEADPRYAEALLIRLEEMALTRRIQELKSKLQRLNPVESAAEYNRMFGELIELERHKKGLRAKAVGEL